MFVLNSYKIFFISCLIFLSVSVVLAKESSYMYESELNSFGFTEYERVNPNLLIYPIKRIAEHIKLNLLFDKEKRKEYIFNLYEVRLKELVYIVNNKKEGFLSFTADRYNSFVGKIKKDYPLGKDEKQKFQVYIRLLERLRDIYPAQSVNWSKLNETIDTTKSLI